MGKLIFWILVILAGLVAVRLIARHNERQNAPKQAPKSQAGKAAKQKQSLGADEPEAMVRCAHCGIHMPRSEAVLSDGKTWCSPEHAKLGVRQ